MSREKINLTGLASEVSTGSMGQLPGRGISLDPKPLPVKGLLKGKQLFCRKTEGTGRSGRRDIRCRERKDTGSAFAPEKRGAGTALAGRFKGRIPDQDLSHLVGFL